MEYLAKLCVLALGGGIDYNSGPYNVTFPAGTIEAYTDIVLVNDDIYENDEMFNLMIDPSSLPSNVTVYNFDQVTVTILNDDCEWAFLSYFYSSVL